MSNQTNTYGRIVNGTVTDVCTGLTAAAAAGAAFEASYIAQYGITAWVQIPTGTVEDATTTDNVNFTPPVQPTRPPQILDKTAFDELCAAALGGGAAGLAAFQAVLDAATAAGGAAKACVTDYEGADDFDLPDAQNFFAILAAAGACTQAQVNAVVAAWPLA
jgi:hypothetical protein